MEKLSKKNRKLDASNPTIRANIKLYLSLLALIVELEAKLKVPRRQGSLDYSKVRDSES